MSLITLDYKGASESFGAGLRTMRGNLVLILPQLVFGLLVMVWATALFFVGFLFVFELVLGWSRSVGWEWPLVFAVRLPALVLGFLAFLAFLNMGYVVILACHRAGYNAMTRKAVVQGRCGLGDYFSGIRLFGPRFMAAGAVESGLKLAPMIFLAAMLVFGYGTGVAQLVTVGGGGRFWAITLVGFLILALAWWALVNFLLALWQPYMALNNRGVVESLTESADLALARPLDLIVLAVLKLVISGVAMFAVGLAITVLAFGLASAVWLGFRAGDEFSSDAFLQVYNLARLPAGLLRHMLAAALFAFFVTAYHQFVMDRLYIDRVRAIFARGRDAIQGGRS